MKRLRRIGCGAAALLLLAGVGAESAVLIQSERAEAASVRGAASALLSGLSQGVGTLECFRQATQYLTELGLSQAEAEGLWQRLDEQRLVQLVQGADVSGWLPYLRLDYAWPERMERYSAQQALEPEWTADQVVLWVNMDLDRTVYEDAVQTEDPSGLTALVNKYHALPEDYQPELVELSPRYTMRTGAQLRPEANDAFVRMADAAEEDGIRLYNVSAYRSYTKQASLYQSYVRSGGAEATDSYSARPGFSEHQTGLTLDINTASERAGFERTEAYAWLTKHSGEYGFILRFPEGKEAITGYSFEPWHYRYVGEETAQLCWERGWTLEEYTACLPAPSLREIPGQNTVLEALRAAWFTTWDSGELETGEGSGAEQQN